MIWALVVLAGFLAGVPVAVTTGTLLTDQVRLQDAMSNAAAVADSARLTSEWMYLAMIRQDLGSNSCQLQSFRVLGGRIQATAVNFALVSIWGHRVVIPVAASVG